MNMDYEKVLEDIKSGRNIQGITVSGYGRGVVWYADGYLHWKHFGESANEATVESLKFIMETIFSECVDWDYCEWSDYHINYIPKNKKYHGFDYSREHPNVCGV